MTVMPIVYVLVGFFYTPCIVQQHFKHKQSIPKGIHKDSQSELVIIQLGKEHMACIISGMTSGECIRWWMFWPFKRFEYR